MGRSTSRSKRAQDGACCTTRASLCKKAVRNLKKPVYGRICCLKALAEPLRRPICGWRRCLWRTGGAKNIDMGKERYRIVNCVGLRVVRHPE